MADMMIAHWAMVDAACTLFSVSDSSFLPLRAHPEQSQHHWAMVFEAFSQQNFSPRPSLGRSSHAECVADDLSEQLKQELARISRPVQQLFLEIEANQVAVGALDEEEAADLCSRIENIGQAVEDAVETVEFREDAGGEREARFVYSEVEDQLDDLLSLLNEYHRAHT